MYYTRRLQQGQASHAGERGFMRREPEEGAGKRRGAGRIARSPAFLPTCPDWLKGCQQGDYLAQRKCWELDRTLGAFQHARRCGVPGTESCQHAQVAADLRPDRASAEISDGQGEKRES